MARSRQVLCFVYGLIAAMALIGTGSQNRHYFGSSSLSDTVAAFGTFVIDTKATAASRSIAIDIVLFFLAAAIFMLLEARKIGIRFVWVYILLGILVAISVTFPLFLIARERKLAERQSVEPAAASEPTPLDFVGLAAVAALTLGLCWFVGLT
jgi:Terpene cyclase DEP1